MTVRLLNKTIAISTEVKVSLTRSKALTAILLSLQTDSKQKEVNVLYLGMLSISSLMMKMKKSTNSFSEKGMLTVAKGLFESCITA